MRAWKLMEMFKKRGEHQSNEWIGQVFEKEFTITGANRAELRHIENNKKTLLLSSAIKIEFDYNRELMKIETKNTIYSFEEVIL